MARILIVDDDRVLRGALRVVLEAAGYTVMDAADAEAGLRLYREQGADLDSGQRDAPIGGTGPWHCRD